MSEAPDPSSPGARPPRRPGAASAARPLLALALGLAAAALIASALAAGSGANAASLAQAAGSTARPASLAAGDPGRGKRVYRAAGCGSCHVFAAAGSKGTLGPNLDRALRGKKAAFVRKSILEPNARIARGYKPSIMPRNYGRTLSKRRLDDLVAFLTQRRR